MTPSYNTPGCCGRLDVRAPDVLRDDRLRPRKLGLAALMAGAHSPR